MSFNSQNTNSVFQTVTALNGVLVSKAAETHRIGPASGQPLGKQHVRWRDPGEMRSTAERLVVVPGAYPSACSQPVAMRPQLWARMILSASARG